MKQTKEYNIKSAAIVNGVALERVFSGFSSTEGFADELVLDLAAEEFKKEFPGEDIAVKKAELIPLTAS